MNTLLSDGTVTLRAMEPADIDIILAWENDTREWTSATTAAPFSRRNIEEYVLTYDADPFSARQLRLMVEAGGRAVGAIDLFDFDPVNRRAGLGLVIDPAARGRGYSVRAIALMARYAAGRLGIHQLWAVTAVGNCPAVAMLRAAGFACAGTLRQWLRTSPGYADACFFQLILP